MDAFDYALSDTQIAQTPAEPRSASRMLAHLCRASEPSDVRVSDLPDQIRQGDLIVVNETRVIPARLELAKRSGGRVEVLLLERTPPDDDAREGGERWVALVRPGRRVPPGTPLFHSGRRVAVALGPVSEGDGRRFVELDSPDVIDSVGKVPLPPYIRHAPADPERYQTVYSKTLGSAAAPTAGLHLTVDVLDRCRFAGAEVATVDLAVGLDTFRPITADKPEDHEIHTERYKVPESTMAACESAGRVLAVGTTTVRALEAAASSGDLEGRTGLYIHGDFSFQVVDVLLTNFHLPRSSLLLLVDAFYGPGWRDLYELAANLGYRFLSFGDAMLIGRGAGSTGRGAGSTGGGAGSTGRGAGRDGGGGRREPGQRTE